MMSDEEMFAWAEAQRAKAAHLSNEELAKQLLGDPMSMVGAAENEFCVDDSASYELARGLLREAAYRLAGIREHERCGIVHQQPQIEWEGKG